MKSLLPIAARRSRKITAAAIALASCVGVATLTAQQQEVANKPAGQRKAQAIVPATKAFLASLDEEQKAKAMFDFGSEKRLQWHFIPKETRKGLPVMEMNEEQQQAAFKLLRSTLSQLGYNKAQTIMNLESVLLQLEGPASEGRRNPEKYYFTIFGTPQRNSQWGLSIEGHHLSLNFTLQGGKIIDTTPQFFATNPAKLQDNYGDRFKKGMQVLKSEEQLGFKLVKSLSPEQLTAAMLPGEVPDEIRAAGEPQPPNEEPRGVAAAKLDESQRAVLKQLLEAYTKKMKFVVAKETWERIEEAGFEKIHFAWSGAKRPGVGHYYAVQGPTFLVEFINVQPDAAGNPANHVHCVWRDMQGDFDLPIE